MLLNYEEISQLGLLLDDKPDNYENASYNLSIGAIINSNGKEINEYTLPPQGMILVVSKECFCLPDTVLGYTTVKNGLSIGGILAINIGIVDSEFRGPISSVLINFGKSEFYVKKDAVFMRMTFHKFDAPTKSIKLKQRNKFVDIKHYVDDKAKDAKMLGDKFLYIEKEIDKFKHDTIKGVTSYFSRIVVYITLLIGVLAFIFDLYKSSRENDSISNFESYKIVLGKLKTQDSLNKKINEQLNSINQKDIGERKK